MSQLLRSVRRRGIARHFAVLALGICLLSSLVPCRAWASAQLDDPIETYRQRRAEAKELEEMEKAAKAGDVRKMVDAGNRHLDLADTLVEPYKTEHERAAFAWFREASEKGYWAGTEALAEAYRYGRGQPADPNRADELEKAAMKAMRQKAEAGDEEAGLALGNDYERGRHGLPKDAAEAVKWYRKAADVGGAAAMRRLGSLYDQGRLVPRDPGEALKWWRKAADAGSGQAMLLLGLRYDSGRGVPKDPAQAQAWYQRAEGAGESSARELIDTPSRVVVEGLKRPLPEVKFDGIALADVIDYLRDVSGTDILVYWNALKEQGVGKDARVTFSAQNIPFGQALTTALAKAGGEGRFTHVVVGETILVSTPQDQAARAAARARRRAALAEDDATALKLLRVLPEVKFEGVSLADVLDFMKDVSGLPVEADWDKLAAVHGIEKDSLVTLTLKNTSVVAAVDAVISSVTSAGKGTPAMTLRGGKVLITVGERPAEHRAKP